MMELASDIPSRTHAELAGTAMEVSHLYGFMASLYRAELSQAQLRSLRAPEMESMLTAAGVTLEGDFWCQPEAALLEELAVEYTALFLGPGGHISPHESVHIESQGAYWGDATTAVRRFITDTGIEYSLNYQGIPDHIGVELEFLSELARRESTAWEQGDVQSAGNCLEYQRDFLDEHLGRWVEKFCTRIVETAELSFYRDVAQLTAQFIGSETEAVEERLGIVVTLADPPVPPRIAAEAELAQV
ncbi:MAG: molecular chaperone TorD family protein [Halopseudomonas sp.]